MSARARRTASILGLVLAGCRAAPPAIQTDAASAPRAPRLPPGQLLATFPGPDYRYELSYEQAQPGQRDRLIKLTLRRGEAVVGVAVIGTDRGTDYHPDPIDADYGVASDTAAWTGETSVGVAARAVNLGPGAVGVLVTLREGREHLTRKHHLYLARGTLAELWSGDDDEVRAVSPPGATHQDLALLRWQVREEGGEVVDQTARRLHWDPARGRLIESPLPAPDLPLALMYLGPYRNREAALAAPSGPQDVCAFRRLILPARLFPGLGLRGVIWGMVFLDLDEGAVVRKTLARCPVRFSPKLVQYVPGPRGGYARQDGPK